MSGIHIKSTVEIDRMRESGAIISKIFKTIQKFIQPGVTTKHLDEYIESLILEAGAKSAFRGYRGFPACCCISVNEEVVHGIGGPRRIQFGDLLKIDIGVKYDGLISDAAISLPVGGCEAPVQNLIDTTILALRDGIRKAIPTNRVSDISHAIQSRVENAGYSVVREFVGHGVGRSVHEEPAVPNYVDLTKDIELKPGMTIAIEPMVNMGRKEVQILKDGWTVVTKDRRLSAHFEHTILITEQGNEILTQDSGCSLY